MKRRKFVTNTALAASSLFLLRCKAERTKQSIEKVIGKRVGDFGIQLWSVRDLMKENPIQTLEQIFNIGYNDIESAGYSNGTFYGMTPKDFNRVLDGIGLKMQSCHTRTGNARPEEARTMTKDWEGVCNDNAELGVKSLVCGYFDESERQTLDDYKRHAELFNKCGEVAKSYGLAFAHHNHDFEFFPIDGQIPYDILLNETDPNFVNFELDNYWIAKGGHTSLEYFEKYPGRFHYWHVKDMDDTEERFFTEVGTGIIDYVSIFRKAEQSGMKYFYVEQDEFKNYNALKSLEMSHDYLREMDY